MNHTCKECGEEKDVTGFVKHIRKGPYEIWNLRKCKGCVHDEYVRRYAKPSKRKGLNASSISWKKRNPEHHARLARKYRKKYPEKITAQNRLNYAIRKGRIEREPCGVCGTSKNVHAHHKSYKPEDWYNVEWLCYVCHKIEQP